MTAKISAKSAAALRDPQARAVRLDMTPERKQRWSSMSGHIVDYLQKHADSPLEAYAILQLVMESFEERYDIRGAFRINAGEGKQS